MARKRKPKPEEKIQLDPNATVFQVGDEIVVKRRVLWTGYRGVVEKVDGGLCRCRLSGFPGALTFTADIPAAELEHDL